jgi:glycosyltransferase involved in cell wall biosynthesis
MPLMVRLVSAPAGDSITRSRLRGATSEDDQTVTPKWAREQNGRQRSTRDLRAERGGPPAELLDRRFDDLQPSLLDVPVHLLGPVLEKVTERLFWPRNEEVIEEVPTRGEPPNVAESIKVGRRDEQVTAGRDGAPQVPEHDVGRRGHVFDHLRHDDQIVRTLGVEHIAREVHGMEADVVRSEGGRGLGVDVEHVALAVQQVSTEHGKLTAADVEEPPAGREDSFDPLQRVAVAIGELVVVSLRLEETAPPDVPVVDFIEACVGHERHLSFSRPPPRVFRGLAVDSPFLPCRALGMLPPVSPPLRVLLLSDACNPEWPSLPIVAYNAALALAEHAEVVLVTHVRNRPNITKAGTGRATVVYLDTEYVAAPMHKLSKLVRRGDQYAQTAAVALAWPAQIAFEWEAWKRYRRELEDGRFDVVQRLTPMSPTLPSPMAKWSPVPFVLGPLNGALAWPAGFEGELRREREYLRYARAAYRLLPFYRSTYARAACILAAFEHTIADLPASARPRTIDFPEVGIDPARFSWPGERPVRDRLTFLFAGRLVPYKCPDVAIRAFAASPELRRHRLVIVGDGPEREPLQAAIAALGLEGTVEMLGQRPQSEVGQLMREADVFVFPSIRELGAGVVIEAMACGCVPVVVSYGGPAALVTEDTGCSVPLGSKEELVDRFRVALEDLSRDRPRIRRLARAAHERAVGRYSWDVKARKMIEVYEWVLGRRGGRPTFEDEGAAPSIS